MQIKTPKLEAVIREAMHHASDFYLKEEREKIDNGEVVNYHDLTINCIGEVFRNISDLIVGDYEGLKKEADELVKMKRGFYRRQRSA